MKITFSAPLWEWPAKAAWFFVTLPVDESQIIRMAASSVPRRGFGSLKVKARVGGSAWATSIFPDSKSGAYLLPVKAAVRRREALKPGDAVEVILSLDL